MTKTIKRRRQEGKTDYNARLQLLKSGKPRLVIRKTNHYLIAQIVESQGAQDKVVFGTTSKILMEKGWDKIGNLKNLTAAYLTGFYLGNNAKSKVSEAILDLGMHRNIQKSRIYALLKGVIDAGIKIPHDAEALPSLEKIKESDSKSKLFDKIKQKI